MNTYKMMLFTGLIIANIAIWCDIFGLGFIVGVILTAIFFILIRKR